MTERRYKGKATPGENLAVIEEFGPGQGTFEYLGNIRASGIGEVHRNFEERRINLVFTPPGMARLPKIGDIVVGSVEIAQGNMISIIIECVNGDSISSSLNGVIFIRRDRSPGRRVGKRRTICKAGDRVRGMVTSLVNSVIHISLEEEGCGVMKTSCTICGGEVAKERDHLSCVKCGNMEERKIAPDYVNIRINNVEQSSPTK